MKANAVQNRDKLRAWMEIYIENYDVLSENKGVVCEEQLARCRYTL